MNNYSLVNSNSSDDLGVVFDKYLRFNLHIQKITKKVLRKESLVSKIYRSNRGYSKEICEVCIMQI
jgi:hypothetical protein